jgi:hypothetical protein
MPSQALRRAAVTLLVATIVTLSCATPSRAAWSNVHRAFDEPARAEPARGFFSLLLRLFDFAGGAMDPNGSH